MRPTPLPASDARSAPPLDRVGGRAGSHLVIDRLVLGQGEGEVVGPRLQLELDDLTRFFVDERHKAAGGFAVEARGRHERVVALDSLWPRLRVEFGPVMPLIVGRVIGECHR